MATDPVTRAQIADLRARVDVAETAISVGVVAGAGLTGTTTHNVGANADGSIFVNADDIQVGVINNTQHGARGGGTLHAAATNAAAGFASAAQITALEAATALQHAAVTLAAVGASANANGASLSGQALTLQPASANFPGLMTAAQVTALAANSTDVTIGTFGAVPTAKGISISGQAITLQPADASNPGALTAGAQTIAGNKSLSGNTGMGQTGFNGYVVDFGNGAATNTYIALYNNGGAPAGIGISSADVRFHGNSAVSGQFSFRPRAADAAVVTIDWVTGAIVSSAGMSCTTVTASGAITSGGIAVPTISSTNNLSNKTMIGCTWQGSFAAYTLGGQTPLAINTGRFMLHSTRLTRTSTLRISAAGTGRLRVM